MSEKLKFKLGNLKKSLDSLNEALRHPVQIDRDRAGIIQEFEMTFELFWKVFQVINDAKGLPSHGPREAFENAFKLGLILEDQIWVQALKDRNQTAHAYDKVFAEAMVGRIRDQYLPLFNETYLKIQKI